MMLQNAAIPNREEDGVATRQPEKRDPEAKRMQGKALLDLVRIAERSAYRVVIDKDESEDVAHRVLRRLLEKRSIPEILDLGELYFERAGRQEALTVRRDVDRRTALLNEAPCESGYPLPDEEVAFAQFVTAVQKWTQGVPPHLAEVARLGWFEQYTAREISDELGISIKTVERHRKEARERLCARFPEWVTP